MKYMSTTPEVHRGVEFVTVCCSGQNSSATCGECKRLSLQCVICHISVRGESIVLGLGGISFFSYLQHFLFIFTRALKCVLVLWSWRAHTTHASMV